jgi:hypothetical protein
MISFGLALLAATAIVPLPAMTESNRALVQPVMEQYTLRRDFPARIFRGRQEQFEFLMDNLVACSALAQTLGLIRYRVTEESPGRVVADNREGARGYMQQVYCGEGQRIYYVDGAQQGLFQARGQALVVVLFTQTTPGTIEYTGQMLVKIDNPVAATLAQMFFVFVKGMIDWHFQHVMNQPVNLTGLALDDPAVVVRCIDQMPAEDYRQLAPFAEPLRR